MGGGGEGRVHVHPVHHPAYAPGYNYGSGKVGAFMAQGRSVHLWPREGRCIYGPGKVGTFMA